jgi:L-aminopeptidase/D-esterase-like protein
MAAHDGLARCIRPVHTLLDGDAIFGLATGFGASPPRETMMALAVAVTDVIERAVVAAIAHAQPAGGIPAGDERSARHWLARHAES